MISILNIDFATFVTTGKMVFLWSLVEWGVALIIASAPLLRPVVGAIIHVKLSFIESRSVPFDKGYPLSSITNALVARNNNLRGASLTHDGGLLDEGTERSEDDRITEECEATNGSTHSNECSYDGQVMPIELGNPSFPNGRQTCTIEQNIGYHPSPGLSANGRQIRVFTEVKVER
jgi:hypothetical protein